jgi:hypothetical protein
MPAHRLSPPWSVEEWTSSKGEAQSGVSCYNLFGSGATPIRFYMGGLHDVAGEANFEAKESGESHNVGSRWCVVVRGWPIRGSRWSGR